MRHLKYSTCLMCIGSVLVALTIAVSVGEGLLLDKPKQQLPDNSIEAGANVSSNSPRGEGNDFGTDNQRVSSSVALLRANDVPSLLLSDFPSLAPIDFPSLGPSVLPSDSPSSIPSDLPSLTSSLAPSGVPNSWTGSVIHTNTPRTELGARTSKNLDPRSAPTDFPRVIPSDSDISVLPTSDILGVPPSSEPSDSPSIAPSITPSIALSSLPSKVPSVFPSSMPSDFPSLIPHSWAIFPPPSDFPSFLPSDVPSVYPSSEPESFVAQGGTRISVSSDIPSVNPSSALSGSHSLIPSDVPSSIPSSASSNAPSSAPSTKPSSLPSSFSSLAPSAMPSTVPSGSPSGAPTITPSQEPSKPPSVVPSNLPSLTTSDAPSTVASTKPSSTPSDFPSLVPSSEPSDIPSSLPRNASSLAPSFAPSDVSRGGIEIILHGESDHSAPTDDQDMKLLKTVGASVAVGSVLAILLVLLAMQRMRSSRSPTHSRGLPTIVIPCNGASYDPYPGVLSGCSKVRADSTTSFALSSTINNLNSDMLPKLGIPIEVMDSMFDDVNSDMSPSSPTEIGFGDNDNAFRDIPSESGCCCGNLATNSEDAYVDALEDPSFGATDEALSDLMALEQDRSCESLSQNSSLKGLVFVGSSHSKEVTKDATQVHPTRKDRGPPQQKAHSKNTLYKTDKIMINNVFDHEQRVVNHMSEMELATTSNMMTPKRSNRSNKGGSNESARRFFRNSTSPRFDRS